MSAVRRVVPAIALSALLASGLAGCDTLGFGVGSPVAPAPVAARALDYRIDDLASLVFAIDLPTSFRPVPSGTVVTFDATNASAAKHFKATLVLADGEAIDGALPPPAAGRTYFLLGFSDKDKAVLRAAQQWVRALPPDAAPVTALHIAPRLCAAGQVDPAAAEVSVVPALPDGPALTPIVAEPVATLLAETGGSLQPCAS